MLVFAISAEARIFVSPDGSRKLEAEFVKLDVAKGIVTLEKPNGERIETELSYFRQADQDYFQEMQELVGKFADIPKAYLPRMKPGSRLALWNNQELGNKVEEATLKGLDWLVQEQAEDGSWGKQHKLANTALALLAFSGHGDTPLSERYGESIIKGLVFLTKTSHEQQGALATSRADKHWVYEHAIATYSLAEHLALSRGSGIEIPDLEETVAKAANGIVKKQHRKSGGWDYNYDLSGARGGDLSITGWHIQALVSCRISGVEVKGLEEALKKAEDYVLNCANSQGGFGYFGKTGLGAFGYDTLTGCGTHCLILLNRASSREARAGIRYIAAKSRFEFDSAWSDLYALYYESHALRKREKGRIWCEQRITEVLAHQQDDGSWKAPANGKRVNGVATKYITDSIYRQALCLLILQSPYR